ncbi:MAG: N-acetylglucosamine-6-phosphate deacetylase [Cyanobacteria bacterium P01_A01_bin.123]
MASYTLTHAHVVGLSELQYLRVEADTITAIAPMSAFAAPDSSPVVDMQGDWISLGGVDLQINGALGLAFPDLLPGHEERLTQIAKFLWHQGIDAFLPTLVTTSIEKFHQALAVLKAFERLTQNGCEAAIALGAHLEGPCLNPAKRGAHPQEYLQPLSVETIKQVLGNHADIVRLITLAPELDGAEATIPYLRSQNITVSLGHSLATATQAQRAFDQGASMVTHAFNAMPGLHHREPGLLGAAIAHPQVACGLIADGQHVCPTMLDILLRASRGQRSHANHLATNPWGGIFLVSDALAPLGLPDGIYPWDSRQIKVMQGTARLSDGTLSGTTLPLLDGVKNLVRWGLCTAPEAIALATEAPRKALGLPGIGVGHPATLLCWRGEGDKLVWQRISFHNEKFLWDCKT